MKYPATRTAEPKVNTKLRRRIGIFAALCLVVLILGVVVVLYRYRQWEKAACTWDAVLVISFEVHGLLEDKVDAKPQDIEGCIRGLMDASVIEVGYDDSGRPVDSYGSPFEVTHERTDKGLSVTCLSAGPDREFYTDDDIKETYSGDSRY